MFVIRSSGIEVRKKGWSNSPLLCAPLPHQTDKQVLEINSLYPDAIYNLGNLYRDQGLLERAVQLYSKFLGVPISTQGQALCVLALASEPSGCDRERFHTILEDDLGRDGTIPPVHEGLKAKLEALRGPALHVTNNLIVLSAQVRDGGLARGVRKMTNGHLRFAKTIDRIHSATSRASRALACTPGSGDVARVSRQLHLVMQYYISKDPARQEEVDACLRRNLANQHFANVHVMVEDEASVSTVLSRFKARKMRVFNIRKRMSFSDVFEYVARNDNTIKVGDAVVLANADIFFDDSIRYVADGTVAVRLAALCSRSQVSRDLHDSLD